MNSENTGSVGEDVGDCLAGDLTSPTVVKRLRPNRSEALARSRKTHGLQHVEPTLVHAAEAET